MVGDKMEVKNSKIVEATVALMNIGNEKLDNRVAYWLGRNRQQLESVSKKVEQARIDIVTKYGVKDEKTGEIQIPKTIKEGEKDIVNPDVEKSSEEFKNFLESTSEVTIKKVKLESFSGININTINAIDFMLDVTNYQD